VSVSTSLKLLWGGEKEEIWNNVLFKRIGKNIGKTGIIIE